MYFECNLPKIAPAYIHPQNKGVMEAALKAIHARMEKLEEALTISGIDGATFSEYANALFDSNFTRFEGMSSDELAQYVSLVHDWKYQAVARLEWPNAEVVVDTAFLTTQEWETIRHLGIGGSDASAVLGKSDYRSPNELYQDKRWTPKLLDREKEKKQAIFDRGHAVEKNVIKAFCDMTHAEVIPETRMFRSKKNPCAIADVDAILRMPNGDLHVFEAKTTVADNYKAWSNNKVPAGYLPQTRHYLAVLDDDRIKGTYIGCLFCYDYIIHGLFVGAGADVGRFVSRLIPRDKRAESNLLKEETSFWRNYVLKTQEPPYIGPYKDDMADLEQYVGEADKDLPPVPLDETFRKIIEDWLALDAKKQTVKSQLDAVQELMDEKALPLAAALAQATKGIIGVNDGLGSMYEVSYSSATQVCVDRERLEHAFPEAFAECVSFKPKARSLKIKIKREKR